MSLENQGDMERARRIEDAIRRKLIANTAPPEQLLGARPEVQLIQIVGTPAEPRPPTRGWLSAAVGFLSAAALIGLICLSRLIFDTPG